MRIKTLDRGCGRFERPHLSRREMLSRSALGFGSLALWDLLGDRSMRAAEAAAGPALGGRPRGKARSVIFLYMGGGPSQVDTFDPKPELTRFHDREVPDSLARELPLSAMMGNAVKKLMGSPFPFERRGKSGLPVSSLFAETGRHADD